MAPTTLRVRLEPAGWPPSRMVELGFSPSPDAIRWAGEDNRVVTTLHRFGVWQALVLAEPVAAGSELALELDGEPPHTDAGARVIPEGRPRPPVRPEPWRDVDDPLANDEVGHAELDRLVELEKRSLLPHHDLAGAGRGLAEDVRAARLFWHVDARLHPRLVTERNPEGVGLGTDPELVYRCRSLYAMHRHLQARFRTRLGGGEPEVPRESLLAAARHVLGYLVRAFDDWYLRAPDLPGGPGPARPGSAPPPRRSSGETGLDRAFARFASGRLRLHQVGDVPDVAITDGAPDGPGIFLWAEVALLAVEFGIDADVWLDLLPGLIQAEELYLDVYGAGLGHPIALEDLERVHAGAGPPVPGPGVVEDLPAPEPGDLDVLVHRHARILRSRVRGHADLAGIDRSGGRDVDRDARIDPPH